MPQSGSNDAGASQPTGFWSRNWPRFFLICSLIVVVLTFVSCIFGLIKIVITPNAVILTIYCLIFSLLAFSAELRQFTWCRGIVYRWMKYVYFLVYYRPRGMFYIFFGLLLLGGGVLLYVAGAVAIAVGVLMLITSVFFTLPVYEDPQEIAEAQAVQERYFAAPQKASGANQSQSQQEQQAGGAPPSVAVRMFGDVFGSKSARQKPNTAVDTQSTAAVTVRPSAGGPPPPRALKEGENALAKASPTTGPRGSNVAYETQREGSSSLFSPQEGHEVVDASLSSHGAAGASASGSSKTGRPEGSLSVGMFAPNDASMTKQAAEQQNTTSGESVLRREFVQRMQEPSK